VRMDRSGRQSPREEYSREEYKDYVDNSYRSQQSHSSELLSSSSRHDSGHKRSGRRRSNKQKENVVPQSDTSSTIASTATKQRKKKGFYGIGSLDEEDWRIVNDLPIETASISTISGTNSIRGSKNELFSDGRASKKDAKNSTKGRRRRQLPRVPAVRNSSFEEESIPPKSSGDSIASSRDRGLESNVDSPMTPLRDSKDPFYLMKKKRDPYMSDSPSTPNNDSMFPLARSKKKRGVGSYLTNPIDDLRSETDRELDNGSSYGARSEDRLSQPSTREDYIPTPTMDRNAIYPSDNTPFSRSSLIEGSNMQDEYSHNKSHYRQDSLQDHDLYDDYINPNRDYDQNIYDKDEYSSRNSKDLYDPNMDDYSDKNYNSNQNRDRYKEPLDYQDSMESEQTQGSRSDKQYPGDSTNSQSPPMSRGPSVDSVDYPEHDEYI
ncbi:unnamed protein product, partial [Owenia fusiformis]